MTALQLAEDRCARARKALSVAVRAFLLATSIERDASKTLAAAKASTKQEPMTTLTP